MLLKSESELKKQLKPESLLPLYLVISKDEYEQKLCADAVCLAFLGKEISKQSKVSFNAKQRSFAQLMQEIDSLLFFAPKRVIIISEADSFSKEQLQRLELYFKNPGLNTVVVMLQSTINRSTKFYKAADKFGVIVDIQEPKPWEKECILAEKVVLKARQMGKTCTPAAAQLLVQTAGLDMRLVLKELEKLICYIDDRQEITQEDINALCATVKEESVWQLGDAIFARQTGQACQVLSQLLAQNISFYLLIRQLRGQFQSKLQIAQMLDSGAKNLDVQKLFPYMRGKVLDKNILSAKSWGSNKLQKALLLTDEAELLSKNSMTDHRLILEQLIFRLT